VSRLKDSWGTRDGSRQSNLLRQETGAGAHGRATIPRFTESGERRRIDLSHPLVVDYEAHSSAPPTVPDALLLDEVEAPPAPDAEPVPESRGTTLGPFRCLKDPGEPREQAPATQRRQLSEASELREHEATQRRYLSEAELLELETATRRR
jgi:hypothetical protein